MCLVVSCTCACAVWPSNSSNCFIFAVDGISVLSYVPRKMWDKCA